MTAAVQSIQKDHVVSMHYTLKDDQGVVIDSSENQEPLTYLQGAGNIIPGLEKALLDQKLGAKLSVRVEPSEAYGEPSEELVQLVDKKMFEGVEDLEVGMVFEVRSEESDELQRIVVRDMKDDQVTVDGNHPLAGVALNFNVEVVTIRSATDEELSNGFIQ